MRHTHCIAFGTMVAVWECSAGGGVVQCSNGLSLRPPPSAALASTALRSGSHRRLPRRATPTLPGYHSIQVQADPVAAREADVAAQPLRLTPTPHPLSLRLGLGRT